MKRYNLILLFIFICNVLSAQQNTFFVKLASREVASFNDAITVMKLFYDDTNQSDIFLENILWAAEKKLFTVTIPIDKKKINPVITRQEFAFWLSKIFQFKKNLPLNRNFAYKECVRRGILNPGRGPLDTFTGEELLETFSYVDYYVRLNNIKHRYDDLKLYEDDYDAMPDWRQQLYRELEEQRERERKLKEQKKKRDTEQKEIEEEKKSIDTLILE